MKLGQTSWILLIFGVLAIAGFIFGSAYKDGKDQQADVNGQIALVKKQTEQTSASVAELTRKQSDLQSQLTTATSNLDTTRDSLTQSLISTDVIAGLYEIAGTSKVKMLDFHSPGISQEDIHKLSYSTLAMTVKVSGSLANIHDFVRNISRKYPLSNVKSLDLNVPVEPPAPPYTWSIESGSLPDWAHLDPATGAISGIPDTAGTYNFNLKVTDKTGYFYSKTMSLTIKDPALSISGDLSYGGVTIPYNRTLGVTCDPPADVIPQPQDYTPAAEIVINTYSLKENGNGNKN